ncbi:histidine kinase [Desulfosporosinus orientis DSM 765]|uniref:histidine kinase n=1 Tax=Desulfosporosinus orientis (strain ATCC 19365 / DSM 765 / NCIMB 8382 / VKM B-1628 / Singapore I) TaxID=768706 RepID=G7WC14_DESOD|nr:HAMP domain-containing sensor histidine kinase [Desulfosporosinus orientis]AET69988.1 histidine kinase [Desulfosporosinus orientis DSM 765]
MFKKIIKRKLIKLEKARDIHQAAPHKFYRTYEEFHRKHDGFYDQHRELCLHHEFQRKHREFKKYHKSLRLFRPASILVNLIILYLLFRFFGIKTISVLFAGFIIIQEFLLLLFIWRIEKRVFKPIDKLKSGVEEISKGNYQVKIESDSISDLGFIALLVDSFNEMAQKLQASEKIKSEYEENRKMLIANISHDLKTPISTVQGYIEAILDGVVNSPDKVKMYLKTIYQNTVYIDRLIDDLFLFSKLDLQKLDFNFELVKAKAFMNDLMEEFKFELEERRYRFYYGDHLETNCTINIDRKRLYQAFRNIIGNAVKYGDSQDLTIKVQLTGRENVISITIEDNGPGIPADKLPHIFDRFYRIDDERTKDLMSTGLGLAIAKELVQAHKGTISVSSIEKAGTFFTINLPISHSTE